MKGSTATCHAERYSQLPHASQVLMNEGIDRRRRFISTVACALGIGVIINPGWATDNLWNTYDGMSTGKRAIRYVCLLVI